MNLAVILPVPNENAESWERFKPHIQQFVATWRQFEPGVDCTLYPILFNWDYTGEVTDLFVDLPVEVFHIYRGHGMDLGAQQWAAREVCYEDDFMFCCTSRMFFHRAGWGRKLIEAREEYGPALYGLTASWESGKLHICTRGHCLDAKDFRSYPYDIISRDQGTFVEVGGGCLYEWAKSIGMDSYLVTWDGVKEEKDWFNFPQRFRHRNQENVLVWDRHTKIYHLASDEERQRLSEMSEPPVFVHSV